MHVVIVINYYFAYTVIDHHRFFVSFCFLCYFNRIDLVNIPGKRSRVVPVLLLPHITVAMDTLVDVRQKEKFCLENKFFFASDSNNGCISHWKVLSQLCNDAELQKPKLIRSTKLRKYMATVAQVSFIHLYINYNNIY